MGDIWLEKYRPYTLEDVEGNVEAVDRLKNIAREGNMPHLLIAGPPGTGKTTSVLALARTLLGDAYKRAVMELNASDDRGIDVVRDRIKSFAREKVDLPVGRHKIVILDEVDSMTEAAQQALRRLMEVHSSTTRFALACNQSTKIIDPIQSRCAIIRFGKLKEHEILRRLKFICQHEKVDYVDNGLETLLFTAEGDMRNAINNLQSTVQGFGLVNRDNVTKVCDMPPPEAISAIIDLCLSAKWQSAHQVAAKLIQEGYTPMDIVAVMKSVLRRSTIAEVIALEYLKLVSRCHFSLLDGVSSSSLQLDGLFASMCEVTMKVCVEAASNAALDVRVLTRKPECWQTSLLLKTAGTSWSEKGDIYGVLSVVTSRPEDVIPTSDIVLIAAPSNVHPCILRFIASYLPEGAVLGCLYSQGGFDWAVKRYVTNLPLLDGVFGFQNIPWICKAVKYGKVAQLIGLKKHLVLASYPTKKARDFARLASLLFDIPCKTVPNFLCLTLSPSNQIIHPARYYGLFHDWDGKSPVPETNIQWGLYTDMDDLSATTLEKLDVELQSIKETLCQRCPKLDLSSVLPLATRILDQYGSDVADTSSLKTIFRTNLGYAGCRTPLVQSDDGWRPAVQSRLFWEDIPYGLCVLKSVAKMLDVPTPTMDKMIRWHQQFMGKTYLTSDGILNPDLVKKTGAPEAYDINNLDDLIFSSQNT